MNDGISDDFKKKFMLPLTIELQDHKEKCVITPQSPLQDPKNIFKNHPLDRSSTRAVFLSPSKNAHQGND